MSVGVGRRNRRGGRTAGQDPAGPEPVGNPDPHRRRLPVRRVPRQGRRWGVRTRSAVAAAVVVTAALLLTSLVLLWVLQRSLESAADAAASARVEQLSAQLQVDAPAELDQAMLATDQHTAQVQVLSGEQVVASSPGAPRTPIVTSTPAAGQQLRQTVDVSGQLYRVIVQGVAGPRGAYTVLVAAVQDPIDATVDRVALLLATGLPVIVLIVGVATYALVGRSLRPVDRIRAGVDAISSSDLGQRVPVPATGDEIARLALTMNAMLDRLQTGQLAQQRFVGDASHELRSPLATVTAGLELARDHPQLLDRDLIGDTLLPEAQRMQALVEDLLLLARADERGLPLRVTEVDMDDLVQNEAARVRTTPAITVRASTHPVRVHGDATQLQRALRNLVDNAVRHARTTVLLDCELTPDGGGARLLVADDGPGVPVADRTRVFDRFVRLDTDRARGTGGSGLGLAITAEIVSAHGGSIRVAQSSIGGAEFIVLLPLTGPAHPPSASSR